MSSFASNNPSTGTSPAKYRLPPPANALAPSDWSVTITGLLYGLTLPPALPLWMVAIGGVMGFANIPLDMMTMVVIPMLLGLAVWLVLVRIGSSRPELASAVRRSWVAVWLAAAAASDGSGRRW